MNDSHKCKDELLKEIKELRERENLYRQLAENIRDVIWIAEPDFSRFIYISPNADYVWGYPTEPLLHDFLGYLKDVPAEDQPVLLAAIAKARFSTESHEVEHRLRRIDGTVRWLHARSFPILDESNKVLRVCGITQDITERKTAEMRVSQLYSIISHELRTPLTSIRGALGLIEGAQTRSEEELLDCVRIAREESDRLIRLINIILDIKKIEANKLELRLERLESSNLIETALSGLEGIAREQNIKLVMNLDPDLHCQGDRDRIIQVLTNLVSNALKFSPAEEEVVVEALPCQGTIRFSVSDHGPGIPEDEQHKLFSMFQQLDLTEARDKTGSGLGLAISKSIVEQHGGQIGFKNVEGGGSTFWFEIPIGNE